jgi:hypothetical protein
VLLGHHDDLAEVGDLSARPLLDELRDRPVEQLVAFDPWFEDVVAAVTDCYRRQDCLGDPAVCPGAPLHEQRPPSVGVQVSSGTQHACTLFAGQRGIDEDDGDSLVQLVGCLEGADGVVDALFATDPEVRAETALQLTLDPVEHLGSTSTTSRVGRVVPKGRWNSKADMG